ncbi:MAG: hypothetical protein ABDH21_06000 [bacterium]
MLDKVKLQKGISLLELIVGVVILLLIFWISSTAVLYFYQHPTLDKFKQVSAYRTVFFELNKVIKEANEVKNIYNTSVVSAIYLQVRNDLYAYRIRRNVPIVQRRLEKSTDGGHSWFILSNPAGIEDIVFRATTPSQDAKVVLVSIRMNSVSKKLSTNHEFAVLLRKKHSYLAGGSGNNDPLIGEYILSGMARTSYPYFYHSNPRAIDYNIQLVTGNSLNSFGMPRTIYFYYHPYDNDPPQNHFPHSNIDTFVNMADNTYNLVFPILHFNTNSRNNFFSRGATTDEPKVMCRFMKSSNNSQINSYMASNIREFSPSYDLGSVSAELIVVGNYLYTVYAVTEVVYDPQAGAPGATRYSHSIYFAYRKNVPNYWQTNTRVSWVKRKIFSINEPSHISHIGDRQYSISSVRMVYGQVGSNRFHVTFILDSHVFTLGHDNDTNRILHTDIYYLGSPDGINWTGRSIDDQFGNDNIYPHRVVPLIGNIGGNSDTLHIVYAFGNPYTSIGYTSTSNTINYRPPQVLNYGSLYPLYKGGVSVPFYIVDFSDMEAVIYNNAIHIVIGCRSLLTVPLHFSIANLVYMVKNNVNTSAIYNDYFNSRAEIFKSVTISVGRFAGTDFVNIFAAGYRDGLHYIRADINSIIGMDLYSQGFELNEFRDLFISSLDSVYADGYLHVSFLIGYWDTRFHQPPPSELALDYIRISHPYQPYQRIANRNISLNLTLSNNTVDYQPLDLGTVSSPFMQAIAVSNYLHILFIDDLIGEVMYIHPRSTNLPSTNSFDTIAVHPADKPIRINTLSSDSGVISYSCYNPYIPYSHLNNYDFIYASLNPYAGTLKVILPNHDITEVDGNRNVSTTFMDSEGARTCGYYNDIQVVNNAIYVAYSELVITPSKRLRLKMAVSEDNGQTWKTSVINNSDSAWFIDLKIKGSIVNITHSDSQGRLIVTKRMGNSWVNFQPPNQTVNVLNRTFLDNQNRLHILSFSSMYFAHSTAYNNRYSPPATYYRIFDNNTNTFLTSTGLVGDNLISVPIYSQTFSTIGTFGDIFVQPDGTVLILTNAVQWSQPWGLDYPSVYLFIRDSNGVWRQPIPINFGFRYNNTFLRTEAIYLRINGL